MCPVIVIKTPPPSPPPPLGHMSPGPLSPYLRRESGMDLIVVVARVAFQSQEMVRIRTPTLNCPRPTQKYALIPTFQRY